MGSAASQLIFENTGDTSFLRSNLPQYRSTTGASGEDMEVTATERGASSGLPDSDSFVGIEPSLEAQQKIVEDMQLLYPNLSSSGEDITPISLGLPLSIPTVSSPQREPQLFIRSVRVLHAPNTLPPELLEEWERNRREHSPTPRRRRHARESPTRSYRPPVLRPRQAQPDSRERRAEAAPATSSPGHTRGERKSRVDSHAARPDVCDRKEQAFQERGLSTGFGDRNECKVCMSAKIDCVLLNCGHLCVCMKCADKLINCPICREHIHRINKVFHV